MNGQDEIKRFIPDRIQWTTVSIVIITWMMSAAITYGVLSTRVNYLEERLKIVESNQQRVLGTYVTREELERAISRMEAADERTQIKLDELIQMHPGKK